MQVKLYNFFIQLIIKIVYTRKNIQTGRIIQTKQKAKQLKPSDIIIQSTTFEIENLMPLKVDNVIQAFYAYFYLP